MMTRKDYVATANILADARDSFCSTPETEDTFENLVADFAEMFLKDNDRFNTRIFYSAVFGEE
jgi:hypothetical protein